jgi:hypothetical protein
MKLERTIQQWRDGVPEIIAEGSKAQVLAALRDAKHDVLALHDHLEAAAEIIRSLTELTRKAILGGDLAEAISASEAVLDKANSL